MCHTFNDNMKTAERSAETFFFAHSGISEANLHPHMIPTFDEKVTMAPVLSADPSSALLVSTPLRGGPASTAIAATSQIALRLAEEREEHDVSKIPSSECILSNFNNTSSKRPRRVSIELGAKDPFVFDNFLPLNELCTRTNPSAAAGTSTTTVTSSPNLKKSKSLLSRKRSSMTNLEDYKRDEPSSEPYPSSKVARSGLKKSPSRWCNLNSLAEASAQDDEMPSFHRISSSSLASSTSFDQKEEQTTSALRSVTPLAWGQFTELDQHQEDQALEF